MSTQIKYHKLNLPQSVKSYNTYSAEKCLLSVFYWYM